MVFTYTSIDTHRLAGITAARLAYNTTNATTPGFVAIPDDQSYVQFVMDKAALSYSLQYAT